MVAADLHQNQSPRLGMSTRTDREYTQADLQSCRANPSHWDHRLLQQQFNDDMLHSQALGVRKLLNTILRHKVVFVRSFIM